MMYTAHAMAAVPTSDGEHQVELGPFDVISVPPGVMRGFRCVHHEAAYLLAIQGGTDPGRVTYATDVVARARELGVQL